MKWTFPYYVIGKGINWAGIERDFKWFRDMKNVPQDAIWHAEGDVQTHTKLVVISLLNLPEFQDLDEQDMHIVFMSALMHDIEKRSTTTTEEREGRQCIVAPRHSQRGEKTARNILYKDMDVPFKIREEICSLIRYHGAPLWGLDDDGYQRKLVRISLRCRTHLLAMLAKADVLGRECQDKDDLLERVDYFELGCQVYKCWGIPKEFESDLARYTYLNANMDYSEFVPYDNSKFEVHMLSGIAGSGKDYYINQELPKLPVISLDGIRRELGIKPQAKKANGKVFQMAKERCKEQMRERNDFVFNATNITKNMRGKWISLFESYGGKVIIHYIEAPYAKLINQNNNRDYAVPEKIIEKMINKLEIPTYGEACDIKFSIQER